MTEQEFLNAVANGSQDILQLFLNALSSAGADYCLIGGLAVNAYAEPVVSLDLDLVVTSGNVDSICKSVETDFKVEHFANSINLSSGKSSLRIQLQTDPRYQNFIVRSSMKSMLGYRMKVASLDDVLQGKIWAYSDETRRGSKRQKDLADIARLVEAHPHLSDRLPEEIRRKLA